MKLQKFREKKGLSRSEAARALDVTESTYYRWEQGETLPRRRALAAIARWSCNQVTANDFL